MGRCIQYAFYSMSYPDNCKIKGRPHKNSKEGPYSSTFNRSKKSVLSKIKQQTTDSVKPTTVYNNVFMDCGGVLGASSCGSLPRNRKQISKLKMSMKTESIPRDSLFVVMEQCKREQSQADPFIRIVQAAPDAMCLLANDWQLHDMARFCTDLKQCSILGIDPTFNVGGIFSNCNNLQTPAIRSPTISPCSSNAGSNDCSPEKN